MRVPWNGYFFSTASCSSKPSPGLSGMVYLERATYLHLGMEITLDAGAAYTSDEMRSVKYNERQYFDHPAFGIIAMVSPIRDNAPAAAH